MNIYFGNLTINQWQNIMNIELTKEDYDWLNNHRQEHTEKISENEFHIFELPFEFHCGSNIVEDLINRLSKYNYSNAKNVCRIKESKK
jgi:hypothetical protein